MANNKAEFSTVSPDSGDTRYPLHTAIKDGNLQEVERIISAGTDINSLDERGDTPLIFAASSQTTEILELLLKAGADIEILHQIGFSALHIAAESGSPGHVKLLIDAGCDINLQDTNGKSPLHFASSSDHVENIDLLLQSGATLDARDFFGLTPLYYAVRDNKLANFEFLIGAGSDVNATLIDDSNLLHVAATLENSVLMQRVMEFGFPIDNKNKFGQTPLLNSARSKFSENAKILLAAGAYAKNKDICSQNALHYAARLSNSATVELFLAKNFPVNDEDDHGNTALTLAVNTDDTEKTKLLLAAGADANYIGPNNLIPILIAVKNDRPEQLKTLLEYGVNTNLTDWEGFAAIHNAAKSKRSECLKLLLEAGVDPNFSDDSPTLPIFRALDEGSVENVDLLLQYGADLTMADAVNSSPLEESLYNDDPQMFEKISSMDENLRGADIEVSTIISIAAGQGHTSILKAALKKIADTGVEKIDLRYALEEATRSSGECVKLLLDAGADVNAECSMDSPPIFHARRNGKLEPIEALLIGGADADVRDDSGGTFLHKAAKFDFDHVNFYLDRSPMHLYKESQNAMLAGYAQQQDLPELAQKFMEAYRLNPINWDGKKERPEKYYKNFPLVLDLVKLLLKFNADVNAIDNNGCTPLHYAFAQESDEIAKELLRSGAKFDIKNNENRTAAEIAVENNWDIEELLAEISKPNENKRQTQPKSQS